MENFETYRLDQTGQQTQAILDQVSTNTADIAQLRALYEALTQSEPVIIQPSDTWPVADPEENVIYRVIDRVNTPPQSYSDYMWNGTAMVLMATYNNAIDNEPTPGSNNFVKSGGVAASIVFDISAYHATGSTLATYANLAAALGTDGANVPASVRKGGMSVKFVKSSDNKYVQYRYLGTEVTGTPNPFLDIKNWVGGEIMKAPSYTELDGLLSNTGSIVSGTRYYHTSPIEVKAGQYLVVKNAIQVNSSISSIALVEENGTFIMPIYVHGVYGKWEYVFTPIKDCYVSISYYTPDANDDKIIGIVDSNDAYEKKLATLKEWLYTEAFIIRNGTVIRDGNGNVVSSDIYYPDKTLGHVSVTRDTNFNVTQLLFTYLNENSTMTISRDANGYVTGTSITI